MMSDLMKLPKNTHKNVERIGVILISSRENCAKCRGRLSTWPDRVASAVIIYDHAHGTIPALHYTKYCRKPGCYYNQHYGYHTVGGSSSISYDSDCLELPYFMASRETAFSLAYLWQFDVHCLIGQISQTNSWDVQLLQWIWIIWQQWQVHIMIIIITQIYYDTCIIIKELCLLACLPGWSPLIIFSESMHT